MVTRLAQPSGSKPDVSTLLRDHPGWMTSAEGRVRRGLRSGDAVWTVVCEAVSVGFEPTIEIHRRDETVDMRLAIDRADPARLIVPDYVSRPLVARGAVHRVRNPDLWDAWVVAALRQHNR